MNNGVHMGEQRRYQEDEVREIFRLASSERAGEQPHLPAAAGLTIGDLQNIGREVGLESTAVARAAASLDVRRSRLPLRTSFGMPIEVGRLVPLPRPMALPEWEMLVAELRTTFGARGRVSAVGGLMEWSNGNLHACIEPTETGHRLRLGTLKRDAATLNLLGTAGVATGAIVLGSALISGGLTGAVFVPWMIAGAGVSAFMTNLLRLPRWAQRREKQMEHIAAKVSTLMEAPPQNNEER